MLKQLDHWLMRRRDLVALLDDWMTQDEGLLYRFVFSVMQDIWKLSLGVSSAYLINRDCEDALHQMLYHCRDMNLTEVLGRLEKLWRYLQSPQNFNHRLMWESGCYPLAVIHKKCMLIDSHCHLNMLDLSDYLTG